MFSEFDMSEFTEIEMALADLPSFSLLPQITRFDDTVSCNPSGRLIPLTHVLVTIPFTIMLLVIIVFRLIPASTSALSDG
jgi:hypothetical protein